MQIKPAFWRYVGATGFLCCAMLYSHPANALVTCSGTRINNVDSEIIPQDYVELNVPILSDRVTVSALRDLPFGSELFSQRIINTGAVGLGYSDCTSSTGSNETFYVNGRLEFENGGPATVGQYQGFDIYETGTPGVGFSLVWRDNTVNRSLPVEKISSPNSLDMPFANSVAPGSGYIMFVLVKTGDIPAGTWTLPVTIPPIITYAFPGQNMAADFQVKGQRIRISGNLNVVAGSCQTPDVHVQLGEYEITDAMNRSNWYSPWKDFNIQLINCPVMAGRYESAFSYLSPSSSWAGEGSSNTFVEDPWYPSVIAYRLDPINEVGFTYLGQTCVKTDPEPNGSEGLCIEIEDPILPNDKSALASSNYDWRGKAFLNQNYLGSNATSYTIPLRARYSRLREATGGTVLPVKAGTANAAVEFTIFYE
ncbi:TPA: type 1 fimbrial protein [Citrobacter sedlakii]|nr:type 1 fimbrial protein [Citrobacter sedlakii]